MINFYEHVKKSKGYYNPNLDIHGIQIPARMIISAGSGVGKSNFLMNLIYTMNSTFHKIIICVKSAEEPLYQHLKEKLEGRVSIYENGEIPAMELDTEETDKSMTKGGYRLSKLIVFDDLILEGKSVQEQIALYYVKARKHGYTSIYIAQSFYAIPIMIRRNCTHYILGRGLLTKDLKSILSIIASGDKKLLLDFSNFYKKITEKPMSVCILDIERAIARGKLDLRKLEEGDVFSFQ